MSAEHAEGEKPKVKAQSSSVAKILLTILIVILAAIAFWYYASHQKYSKAEGALNAVLDACGTRNRYVIAERMVDAKRAFAELPPEDQSMYGSKLYSRMKFIGCSTY